MSADPRSRAQRRRDTEHRLTHDIDVWVASASADGAPYLVPLSFDWDGDLLRRLRDKGNTVLVVEHEPEAIAMPTTSSTSAPAPARPAAASASRAASRVCGPAAPSPAATWTTAPP
jgi:hypothetical protein